VDGSSLKYYDEKSESKGCGSNAFKFSFSSPYVSDAVRNRWGLQSVIAGITME